MSTKARTVLVVEDAADLREIMAMALTRAGFRVVVAADGREALEQTARERPALILLDMRMPGMSGWEFMEAFHAKYGRSVPVVVVTANDQAERVAAEVGADGALDKPFRIRKLLRVVEQYIGDVSGPGHDAAPARR